MVVSRSLVSLFFTALVHPCRCDENGREELVSPALIGHETQGSCGSTGRCYDYRNALCKDGKCSCLAWNVVADNDVCVVPGHCSRYTSWGCDGSDKNSCPDWLGGAVCDPDGICKCPSGQCATSTIGYWAYKDTVPRCQVVDESKPESRQTCNKLTGATCWLAQTGAVALQAASAVAKVAKSAKAAVTFVKSATSGAEAVNGAAAVEMVKDLQDGSAMNYSHQIEQLLNNATDTSDLVGYRDMADGFPNPDAFGEGAMCDGWRDAICTHPITPHQLGGVGGVTMETLDAMTDGDYHGHKSHDCMCRPQDCTVYSKKNKGLACVFSFLLVVAQNEGLPEVTFETITRKLYDNMQQALSRHGRDDPAEFFEIEHRHMLRKYSDHHECIVGMHSGHQPDPDCRAFVCSFASASSGASLRSMWLCSPSWQVAGVVGISVALCGVVLASLMITLRRKLSAPAHDEALDSLQLLE